MTSHDQPFDVVVAGLAVRPSSFCFGASSSLTLRKTRSVWPLPASAANRVGRSFPAGATQERSVSPFSS